MTRVILLAALTLVCLAWGPRADAGLVERDLFEPGDRLLTYDEAIGREWLDFSVTRSLWRPDDPTSVSMPDELAEFQVATLADVESLMASASVPELDAWSLRDAVTGRRTLIEMLGETGESGWDLLGEAMITGGFVAQEGSESAEPATYSAVLAFEFGTPAIALGSLSNSHGFWSVGDDAYPFAYGPVDYQHADEIPSSLRDAPEFDKTRFADDVFGPSSPRFIRVVDPDGNVIATILDTGDLYTFEIPIQRMNGFPAYWVYRDAVAVPEPGMAGLAFMVLVTSFGSRPVNR